MSEKPKIKITTDEEGEAQRTKEQDAQRQQDLEDLKTILSTPHGMRFFKRFFTLARVFSTSMTGNSWTFFNEGQRNFALQFMGDIVAVAPERIPELMTMTVPAASDVAKNADTNDS